MANLKDAADIVFELNQMIESFDRSLARMKKMAAGLQADIDKSNGEITIEINTDSKESFDFRKAFDEWYAVYPRKVGKGFARRCYERSIRLLAHECGSFDAAHKKLISASHAFLEHVTRTDKELKYVPHPSTWLNREGWEDDIIKKQHDSRVDNTFAAETV